MGRTVDVLSPGGFGVGINIRNRNDLSLKSHVWANILLKEKSDEWLVGEGVELPGLSKTVINKE